MRINFGYVAMSVMLEDCSPSKTVTVANLSKLKSEEIRLAKLNALATTNIKNTQRLFYHNQAHDIHVFRLTSKLIPLATHPIAENWDWISATEKDFKMLGEYARDNQFRISAHPDHFTLLNSPREEVIEASLRDLEYHHNVFEAMELDSSAKLVIHVGGRYGNKTESMHKFITQYKQLPPYLKARIILENDDKIYTAQDVLEICQQLNIPMVLDIHHHWCNNNGEDLKDSLQAIFDTWKNETIPPKIHLSSPKNEKDFRAHADFIEPTIFIDFLGKAMMANTDFDVMIEAKQKDAALFKLMDHLQTIPWITPISQSAIEITNSYEN